MYQYCALSVKKHMEIVSEHSNERERESDRVVLKINDSQPRDFSSEENSSLLFFQGKIS